MAIKFVVCLDKQNMGDFSSEDLTVGRIYEVIEQDAGNSMIRIIDESGEDYLYPASWFESVELGDSASVRLRQALNKIAA